MAAAPTLVTGNQLADWGPVLRIHGLDAAPAGVDRLALGNVAVITEWQSSSRSVTFLAYENGDWAEYATGARSLWAGEDLLTLIPLREVGQGPEPGDRLPR